MASLIKRTRFVLALIGMIALALLAYAGRVPSSQAKEAGGKLRPPKVAAQAPTPSSTPTATSSPTAAPTATPTPDLRATERAKAVDEAARAIAAELDEVGMAGFLGYLDWVHPGPLEVQTQTYGQLVYLPVSPNVDYADFVLHVDVAWDSRSGLSGCGVIFRSEPDLERGEQFRFYTLRLSGLPGWDVELWRYGQYQSTLTGEVKYHSIIDQQAGAINKYVLVATEDRVTIYVNRVRLGSVTITRREAGRIAFFVWQESGESTCTFSNAWIWVFGPPPADRTDAGADT